MNAATAAVATDGRAAVATPVASVRFPQFDGLRALAFLGVFAFHAVAIPYTWMGVDLFFVLSGYLITRNLLVLRDTTPPGRAFAAFFWRRLLRIVPPYYVALLLVMLVQPYPWHEAGWYFAFASNVRDTLYPPIKGQLLTMWSIAVEEQFYLVWPWLVLLLPRRRLPVLIAAVIFAAPLFRALLTPFSADAVYRLTVCRGDLLGLGAAVAWLDLYHSGWIERHARAFAWTAVAATATFVALALRLPTFDLERNDPLYNTLGYALEAITFTCVLVLVRVAPRGPLRHALSGGPLAFLGRISYMAYLCHVVALDLARRLGFGGVATVGLGFAFTVAMATASWYLLERPLQALRSRVPA